MADITICSIDPETQVFTGSVTTIDEQAAVPAGWVAAEPPDLVDGWFAVWTESGWEMGQLYEEPEPDELTICRVDPDTGAYAGESLVIAQGGACPVGWVRAEPPAEPAEGMVVTWSDGAWVEVEAPAGSIEPARKAQRARLDATFQSYWTANFAWDFGEIEGLDDLQDSIGPAGVRSLQFRDLQDQANWTAAHTNAVAAIMIGQPSRIIALKCDDNVWVQTTAQQALVVLTAGTEQRVGLFGRQSSNLARYGALKKLNATAADQAALDAVEDELALGWEL